MADTAAAGDVVASLQLVNSLKHFWSKVDKTTGCWLWTGAANADGYGRSRLTINGERFALAHRVAYRLLVGPIPAEMTLDHLCRVRLCVKPDHLDPVPSGVNAMRGNGPAAAAARRTHCSNGHEFTPGNTLWLSNGKGERSHRRCRTCNAERLRERRRRRRGNA
jgi:hypothetical protein